MLRAAHGMSTMTKGDWDRIQELFLAALDLEPAARRRYLDSACAGNAVLRSEVEELLAADRKAGSGIVSAVESAAKDVVEESGGAGGNPVSGQRIGSYRLVREIGRGGMGSVYLAERDDAQFDKQVAVKLIRRGLDTEDVLERFRHERQILANLEHPFIARLLDGGTAPDGRPFLVMEYVHGVPLDRYCEAHASSITDRCRLFLKICEAVAFAHRNLVVHRDLKPGNILVTEEGEPKLLDFGVAKLLDPDTGSGRTETESSLRRITPDYASPEQIRSEWMTTAADVYSLGAVLYELLSGKRPHQFPSYSTRDVERVICEQDPPKPSEIAPPRIASQLAGDLDAITAKAMRKEPEQRYGSVEQLANDVERYLAGDEVLARRGNLAYRAKKFVRRNATSLAVAFVLVTATAVATREAVTAGRARANAERDRQAALESQREAERAAREAVNQRTMAESHRREAELQRSAADEQRLLAEQRFGQLRQMSGKFLFEFHDAIASLPGSTPARKLMVETGLAYYDRLVKDAQGNQSLLEETARGYERLGDVQGNPFFANLGDPAGAMASYEKARRIRAGIVDPSADFLADRIGGDVRIAEMQSIKGDVKGALAALRKDIAMGESSVHRNVRRVEEALARAYSDQCAIPFLSGAYADAIEPAQKLLELWTTMSREGKDPKAEKAGLSLAHTRLGDALMRIGRYEESLPHIRLALGIDKELLEANPSSAGRLKKYYVDHCVLWLALRKSPALAAPGEAKRAAETAAELADRLRALDPANHAAWYDVMSAQAMLGDWFLDSGDAAASVPHYRKAAEAMERFASARPNELLTHDTLAYVYERLGNGLSAAGQVPEGLAVLEKAEEAVNRAARQNPGLLLVESRRAELVFARGSAYAKARLWAEAAHSFERSAALFEALAPRDPKNRNVVENLIQSREKLADAYAALEQWGKARDAMESALRLVEQSAAEWPLAEWAETLRKSGREKLVRWAAVSGMQAR